MPTRPRKSPRDQDASRRVDAYLASVEPDARKSLRHLRATIKAAVPRAEDAISYGFPAFRLDGRLLVCYKAAKEHCSFHPMSSAVIPKHAAALESFSTSKGTVRFDRGKTLPVGVVRKLLRSRIAELSD